MSTANRDNVLASIESGKFFGVTFIKADKSIRHMQCRMGVKKHLKGGHKSGCDVKNNLITVWSTDADDGNGGYRRFKLDKLIQLRVDGSVYDFEPIA